jgi:hypothetical protein
MDVSREMFEGLKQTADGLIMANEGIKRSVDAALHAKEEPEDLRVAAVRAGARQGSY